MLKIQVGHACALNGEGKQREQGKPCPPLTHMHVALPIHGPSHDETLAPENAFGVSALLSQQSA